MFAGVTACVSLRKMVFSFTLCLSVELNLGYSKPQLKTNAGQGYKVCVFGGGGGECPSILPNPLVLLARTTPIFELSMHFDAKKILVSFTSSCTWFIS